MLSSLMQAQINEINEIKDTVSIRKPRELAGVSDASCRHPAAHPSSYPPVIFAANKPKRPEPTRRQPGRNAHSNNDIIHWNKLTGLNPGAEKCGQPLFQISSSKSQVYVEFAPDEPYITPFPKQMYNFWIEDVPLSVTGQDDIRRVVGDQAELDILADALKHFWVTEPSAMGTSEIEEDNYTSSDECEDESEEEAENKENWESESRIRGPPSTNRRGEVLSFFFAHKLEVLLLGPGT